MLPVEQNQSRSPIIIKISYRNIISQRTNNNIGLRKTCHVNIERLHRRKKSSSLSPSIKDAFRQRAFISIITWLRWTSILQIELISSWGLSFKNTFCNFTEWPLQLPGIADSLARSQCDTLWQTVISSMCITTTDLLYKGTKPHYLYIVDKKGGMYKFSDWK